METTLTTDEAFELKVFLDNDSQSYKHLNQIRENVQRHAVRGNYRHDLAIKAFGYVAETAAKRYHEVQAGSTGKWYHLFPPAVRAEVATELADEFHDELLENAVIWTPCR